MNKDMSQKLRKNYISCPKCRKQRHINTKEKGLVSVHCSCGEQLYPFKNSTPKQTTAQLPDNLRLDTHEVSELALLVDELRENAGQPGWWRTVKKLQGFIAQELSTQQTECEQKVAEAVKAEREKFAKYFYEQMPYDGTGKKPKWIDGGNSLKQDEARKMVLTALTNTEGEA